MFDRESIFVDSKVLTQVKLCRSLWIDPVSKDSDLNQSESINMNWSQVRIFLLNFNRSRTNSIKIQLEGYGIGFYLDAFVVHKKIDLFPYFEFKTSVWRLEICFADHSIISNSQNHSNTIISSRCFLSFYFSSFSSFIYNILFIFSSFSSFYMYFHHFPLFLLF